MPYTFAHPGYILPFKKLGKDHVSATGLAFGSIAPDYDILFRLTNNRFHLFQYDAFSIVFIIFPLALGSAIAFHMFCRNVLILHLPEPFKSRYEKYLPFDFIRVLRQHYLRVSFSILMAICLHLFLDFLCHYFDSYETQMFVYKQTQNEFLANMSAYWALYFLPVCFSLGGFYLLWKFLLKGVSLRSISFSGEKIRFWVWIAVAALLLGILKIYFTHRELNFLLDFLVISMTSSIILSVYLVCTFYYFNRRLYKKKSE